MPPKQDRFPVLIGDPEQDWAAATLLIREVCMLKFIEEITNKSEWWRKLKSLDVTAKWKAEALDMDWSRYLYGADFTLAMAESVGSPDLRLFGR